MMMIPPLRFQILISFIRITAPQMLQIATINQKEDSTPVGDIKAPTCMHVRSRGYLTLRGGLHSGRFTKHLNINDIDACLDECCGDETCNVAYLPGTTCYTIACTSSYLCDSIPAVASSLPAEDVQVAHVIRNKDDTYQDDMLRRTQKKRHVVYKNSTTTNSRLREVSKKPMKKTDVDAERYYKITSRLKNKANRRNGTTSGTDVKGAVCEYSCVISRRGMAPKVGNTLTMFKCADQCCQERNCKAAVLRNNKCSAINNVCEGSTNTAEAIDTMMIRVTKRNGERVHHGNSAMCSRHCPSNKCDEIPCFCDKRMGIRGKWIWGKGTGLFHCRHSNCHPECGDHGTCDVNSRCLCEQGWTGVSCNRRKVCTPPCTNGICLKSNPRKCKCDFGWSGPTCNRSYMEPNDGYQGNGFGQERNFGQESNFGQDEEDMDVGEGGRDGVYFVDSVSLPELNVRLPRQQRRNDSRWRTIATIVVFVICGVGVTSLVVSAVIVIARRMVLHKVDHGYGKLFDAN